MRNRPLPLLAAAFFVLIPGSAVLRAEELPLETPIAIETPVETLAPEPLSETEPVDQSLLASDETVADADEPEPEEQEPEGESQSQSMTEESSQGSGSAGSDIMSTLPKTSDSNGSLTYAYGLKIPPGRKGIQPELALRYDSALSDNDSPYGYGWRLSIPSIERMNWRGSDRMYEAINPFTSSIDGELTNTATGTFMARFQSGDFNAYSYTSASGTWTMRDKRGTLYTFGSSTSSRVVDTTGGKVFRWMLDEIRDLSGNFVRYEYYKDGNQAYPSKIFYTGSGVTDGPFEIELLREFRSDDMVSYAAGFPVTTSYRVSEIVAKIGGSWVRKYELDYANGDGGSRSLLTAITESGRDEAGVTTALPAQAQAYLASTPGWTTDTSYSVPLAITNSSNGQSEGVQVADFTGDGLVDYLQYKTYSGYPETHDISAYVNNGNGTWTQTSAWNPPVQLARNGKDYTGVRLFDVNSDGRTDFVHSNGGAVYLNNGAGWTYSATHTIPLAFTSTWDGSSLGVQAVDVNGDGLEDLLKNETWNGGGETVSYINNGDGTWRMDLRWNPPPALSTNGKDVEGVRFLDVNGDGLVDIVHSNEGEVYLNTGSGWTLDAAFSAPLPFTNALGQSLGVAVADVNNDGLADFVKHYEITGNPNTYEVAAYLNKGDGTWVDDQDWHPPMILSSMGAEQVGVRFIDMNGDGTVDMLHNSGVMRNMGTVSDLLKRVTTPRGGKTDVEYKGSALYRDGSTPLNPEMPVTLLTAHKLTSDDGFGTVSTSVRTYANGKFWYGGPHDQRFAGFGQITARDAASNTRTTWYHQGDASDSTHGEYLDHVSKIGKPYRVEARDVSGNLFSRTISKWDRAGASAPGYSATSSIAVSMQDRWLFTGSSSTRGATVSGTNVAMICGVQYAWDTPDQVTGMKWNGVPMTLLDKRLPSTYNHWYYLFGLTNAAAGTHDFEITASGGAGGQAVCAAYQGVATPFPQAGYYASPYVMTATHTMQTSMEGSWVVLTAGNYASMWYDVTGIVGRTVTGAYRIFDTDGPVMPAGSVSSSMRYIGDLHGVSWQEIALSPFWSKPEYGGYQWDHVKLVAEVESAFDGNGTHKDSAETYSYDSYGNLSQKVAWGEVVAADDGSFTDAGSDKFTTATTYATNTPAYVVGLPSSEATYAQSGAKVRESLRYYDALSLGSVDKGSLTKEELWKSGSSYANTQNTYDVYGLVTQSLDARGKATTYTYDAYNLYSATTTSPLGLKTYRTPDYSSGKFKKVIEPTGAMYQTIFDGLDRVVEEKQPDQSTSSTQVTKTQYVYTDTSLAGSVKRTDWLDGSNGVDSWTYLDGFERPIQTRKESETGGTYVASDVLYNALGLTDRESLPYFSSGSSRTSSATDTNLYTIYAYDALRRPSSVVNGIGTTAYAYDDWKTTVTDPRGGLKSLYRDAHGRLSQVDEVLNATNTFVTAYAYDGNGNLTKITDALGNLRNFTYDGLGRRLTAEDLHASADGTFGTWTYTHDDAGNLMSVVDPIGRTIVYAYDDLNRMTSEDNMSATGTEVTYTYDSCLYGKGKLCGVSNAAISSSRQYGHTGQVTRETKTISSTEYQADMTYDRQGNELTAIQPDGSETRNTYDAGGLLDKIERKEAGGAWTDVVRDLDWSPLGIPTMISYANGATSTNTYDASKLYRLTRKTTTVPGGTTLQDTTYLYDAVGNVTQFVESSSTAAIRATTYAYDALNRLISAASNYSGEAPAAGGVLDTAMISGPAALTWSATATLAFHANNTIALFECKLDAGGWSSCSAPVTYAGLAPGEHTFQVRATNAAGYDTTPATHVWTIITTPADGITVDSTASCSEASGGCGSGTTLTKSMTITSEDQHLVVNFYPYSMWCPGDVTVTFDGDSLTSTHTLVTSGNNWHQFELSNPSYGTHDLVITRPGSCQYTVLAAALSGIDLSNPRGTIASAYGGAEEVAEVNVTALAGGLVYSAIVTPNNAETAPVSPLSTVVNQFSAYINAGSAAANTSSSGTFETEWSHNHMEPYSRFGLISTPFRRLAEPQTGLNAHPVASTWSTTATFEFASPVATATFECKLDSASWTACTSPASYAGLSQGSHSFQVRAVNASVPDSTPATWDWIVTAPPPPPSQGGGPSAYAETFTYDPLGNLLFKVTQSGSSTPAVTAYGYAHTNKANPHAATSVGGVAYAYDDNGNLTSRASDTFTWDFKNRLTTASIASATNTFAYDPSGERVLMTASSSTTAYASKSYSVTDGVPTKHLFAGPLLVATVEGSSSTATVRYVHTDHLTGSSVVTSAAGTLVEVLDYHAFGSIRVDDKATGYSEVRKYAGHEYDVGSGLSYMGARYYDGNLGRFLSQDPVFIAVGNTRNAGDRQRLEALLSDPQQLNSYAYARNNPLAYIDPDGNIAIPAALYSAYLRAGDWGNRVYASNSAAAFVMDHPYVPAAIGAAPLAAYGAVAAAPAVASGVGQVASSIGAERGIRAGVGATLNVASTYLNGKVEGRDVSGSEYAYSAVTGAGLATLSRASVQAVAAGGANLVGQVQFKGTVDPYSVGISTISSGLGSMMTSMPGMAQVPQLFTRVTEQAVGWTIETPAQVMSTGIQRSVEDKRKKK